MTSHRITPWLAALLVAAAPALLAGCGEEPPAKTPTRPVTAGSNPTPGQAQIGMSDTKSSVRPGDLPDSAKLTMNGSAQGDYARGLQAFAVGDLATAKQNFQQATQADPRAHQAFYSLGVVQERLRDPGALASYRQAMTIVPDYEPAIIAAAMYMARKGQLSDAERLLTEKRGQMPKSAAVIATLAEVKSLEKDTGSAQRLAQEALKINPDYRPAMVIIARDHYRNRRLDLALYALQAILDGFEPIQDNPPRDKDNAEAMLLRGLIYREQGQRAQAMAQFKEAVQKRPDLVEARVAYASYLLEAGNAQEALPILEGAVHFDNEDLAAHLDLGDAYRLVGRYPDAKREFEWVAQKDSTLPQVHYDLGLLYLFAPNIPGMTPMQQVTAAQQELTRYQQLRKKGDEKDDSDELLNRAKLKEGELKAAQAPATPAKPATPAAGAKPGATPSAKPAAAPPSKK
ncbi:MAG TPA: tetratricopeptide repeat protein [Minicystis sp.]|nr:tetratricopeptide repeat protein [Minicystis sp.]